LETAQFYKFTLQSNFIMKAKLHALLFCEISSIFEEKLSIWFCRKH